MPSALTLFGLLGSTLSLPQYETPVNRYFAIPFLASFFLYAGEPRTRIALREMSHLSFYNLASIISA
jgi:hypothetical protein